MKTIMTHNTPTMTHGSTTTLLMSHWRERPYYHSNTPTICSTVENKDQSEGHSRIALFFSMRINFTPSPKRFRGHSRITPRIKRTRGVILEWPQNGVGWVATSNRKNIKKSRTHFGVASR